MVKSLADAHNDAWNRVAELKALLVSLVAEVAQECCAPKDADGPPTKLAEGEAPICGRPARWGILTAWTCSKHRRPSDRNAIGGPALQAAMAALDARAGARLRARSRKMPSSAR
jgi:hypothetical protein